MELIAYHGSCADGFCAAFIAQKRWPQAQLLPCTHGQGAPLREARGKNVLVVDFSWKRDVCLALKKVASSLTILDHHKTAETELQGLPFVAFDVNRSGATLTWDTLFPGVERPWYTIYVEDRDLWRWQLPDSREINGYIMALPHTVEAWSALDKIDAEEAVENGRAIRMHIEHYVEKVVEQRQIGKMGSLTVACVNAPYLNISEVGNELLDLADVGLGWYERGDGLMQFSLRSRGDIDVSHIAQVYRGGGHKYSSGFVLSLSQGRDLLDEILGRKL